MKSTKRNDACTSFHDLRRSIAASLAALTLAGCSHLQKGPPAPPEPTTAVEVGNVYVSAYPAIAWEDVAEQLEPKQNLTIEQARQLAIQSTQSQVFQFLSTFAAGLAIGLPTRTISETTTGSGDGKTSTTSTRTKGTGTVPAGSGTASSAIGDAALSADLSKGPLAIPADANTLLTAAHALYQQAKILDNQISKAVIPRGYRAHLVTLQVNLQPTRRDYGYDTYVNVSLMPGSWKESLATSQHFDNDDTDFPAVIYYPLIITDALETSSVARSAEMIRQLSLSLSGVVGGVGISAGAGSGADSLESLLGSDKNSLITLGRISDSTLRIRIGAQNAGSTKFAMVPRTYNVSLVVLTRNVSPNDRVESLSLITWSSLVSSTTGRELPAGDSRKPAAISKEVLKLVSAYGLELDIGCGGGPTRGTDRRYPQSLSGKNGSTDRTTGDESQVAASLQLLRALNRGDYQEVNRCLKLDNDLDVRRELSLRRLLAELSGTQTTSRYSTILVALRQIDDSQLPETTQLVLAKDDKATLSATARGGAGLIGSAVAAKLMLKSGRDPDHILPNSVSIAGGKDVTASFPSLSELGLQVADLSDKPLTLTLTQGTLTTTNSYKLAFATAQKPNPPNPAHADSVVVVSDAGGSGRLTLTVGKMPEGVKGKLRVTVQGADLRDDKALSTPAVTARGVALQAESVVTLSLANLSPAKPVVVTTFADDTKLGESLIIPVERTSPVSK